MYKNQDSLDQLFRIKRSTKRKNSIAVKKKRNKPNLRSLKEEENNAQRSF
jgi:hypothetical protein